MRRMVERTNSHSWRATAKRRNRCYQSRRSKGKLYMLSRKQSGPYIWSDRGGTSTRPRRSDRYGIRNGRASSRLSTHQNADGPLYTSLLDSVLSRVKEPGCASPMASSALRPNPPTYNIRKRPNFLPHANHDQNLKLQSPSSRYEILQTWPMRCPD